MEVSNVATGVYYGVALSPSWTTGGRVHRKPSARKVTHPHYSGLRWLNLGVPMGIRDN